MTFFCVRVCLESNVFLWVPFFLFLFSLSMSLSLSGGRANPILHNLNEQFVGRKKRTLLLMALDYRLPLDPEKVYPDFKRTQLRPP